MPKKALRKGEAKRVGNTPGGKSLYTIPPGRSTKGYHEAGALDIGDNAAGGRVTRRVYTKKNNSRGKTKYHPN